MEGSIGAVYNNLKEGRSQFVTAAILSAQQTIPALFVREDEHQNMTREVLRIPDSSVGATGTNSLATALLLAIFPSNAVFFRTEPSQASLNQLEAEIGDPEKLKGIRTELEQSARKVENQALEILESGDMRPVLYEILRQYLLGQVLIYIDPKTNKMRGFKLNQHVNVRDQAGNALRYIVEEWLNPLSLTDAIREEAKLAEDEDAKAGHSTESLALYTDVYQVGTNKWETVQELNGVILESTRQKFNKESLPWFDIGYNRVIGEQYARGYLEQLLGNLRSVNGLRRAIVEGSLISARTIFMVDPASSTSAEQLAMVPNGGFVRGRLGEVNPVRIDKANDFQVALAAESAINQELNIAFMSHLAARRDAERVTAEEFSSIASEIDQTLGGTFSRLGADLQRPIATLTLGYMKRKGFTKDLLKGGFKVNIITGISALGRGTDLNRLRALLTDIQLASSIPGQETIGQGLESNELSLRLINGHGINATGLLKSEESVQAANEQAAQAQQQEQMGQAAVDITKAGIANPEGAEQMGAMFAEGMGQQPEQPQ